MLYKIKINKIENKLKKLSCQVLSILGKKYFESDLAKITPVAGNEVYM
jgi:hypothetical protein